MEVANLVLEYLKVFLSWPPVLGALAIVLLVIFREDIKALLLRLASIKVAGGSAVFSSQSERSEREERREPLRAEEIAAEDLEEITEVVNDAKVLVQQLEAERATSLTWEFRFLNYFLVARTQFVLDWLIQFPQPIAATFYDAHWNPHIPSARERNAIIAALSNHHLIQFQNGMITVTPKGRQYSEWRGPMAQNDRE